MTSLIFFAQEHVVPAASGAAAEPFSPGELIIGHVSNSALSHPLIHLPTILGIDFSVTKHVLMIWLVAALLFVGITTIVRRYVRQPVPVPARPMAALEITVEFVRDQIVRPAVGTKWAAAWMPLLLTFFLFILGANVIGLIPIFDVVGLLNHYVLHTSDEAFLARVVHGGTTATGNFNVTAALAMITFGAIIVAGTRAHGFVQHWKNLVPHGLPGALYVLLIPLEIIGMLVRPFALTMRLAANMTGGHIAILAILSLVFVFAQMMQTSLAGIGVGVVFSLPLAVAISMLEIIVVLVQAYVFTLLSAVFIGMAIHAHH
ncbi:MAG TPA: F0F1 ATP synthase subunit A [Vicinamibacterales bacterium]|jgi:F-type H+-transporting ATPase subunit a|nr:F0F1 ATP synthase subunit A [Vicinamibacterales bacterium]